MAAAALGEAADRLRKSTVEIQGPRRGSAGSGVVWGADGTIITNAHVIRSGTTTIALWDGRPVGAEVIASDPARDLARLQAAERGLPAANVRDSSGVRPGEVVIAVGNPLGFTGAMSTGVVHAVGPRPGLGRKSWIQAAVRLAPGNSGGPLADAHGNVIGINTMVANGLGLAVPSDTVRNFLMRGAPPRLGVTIRPVQVRQDRQVSLGLLVLEIAQGSLAENASLRPGDVLLGAGGQPFETLDDLTDALDAGRSVELAFLRGPGGNVRRVTVPLEGTVV